MSIQPEELVSPQERFWEQDPTILREPDPFAPARTADEPELARIGVGIAAAVVVLGILTRQHLAQESPRTPEEVRQAAKRVWNRITPGWMKVALPAISQAYRLGSTGNITYSELEQMASVYAMDLGDYITESSTEALAEGFAAQVNAGWNEQLAWVRAREAYGLDSQQMRSYVKGLLRSDKTDYVTDPIPAASRMAVDRAFMLRADRLGSNEAYKATQVGKNMVWMTMEATNRLPTGTMKRWVTAEDERVCPVCAPLDGVMVPLHGKFHSAEGSFYAPGVHPNCRCDIELVYPLEDIVKAMPGDPYDRDEKGRFAEREERKKERPSPFAQKERTSPLAQERRSALGLMQEAERPSISAFFERPKMSALEANKPSLSQMMEADKTKTKRKFTIQYRPNEQGQMVAQTVELPQDAVNRPHEYPVWMYANEFIDDGMMEAVTRQSVKKPGTVIDFSELSTEDADYQQMVHTDRENTPEDAEASAFAFEAAYNDAMNSTGIEMLQYRNEQVRRYGRAGGDIAHYGKFGNFTPYKGPEIEEYRKTLAGMRKEDLIKIIQDVEFADRDAAMYFGNSSEDFLNSTISADEVADTIISAVSAELLDSQSAALGSGIRPNMTINSTLYWLSQDIDTERVDRSRAVVDDDFEKDDVYMFKFNGWYGFEISQFDSREPSGALSGKYRVVSHREATPPADYTHKGAYEFPEEVGRMGNVFRTIHIIELEPVLEPLAKALSNLSAFKGGMTHAGR